MELTGGLYRAVQAFGTRQEELRERVRKEGLAARVALTRAKEAEEESMARCVGRAEGEFAEARGQVEVRCAARLARIEAAELTARQSLLRAAGKVKEQKMSDLQVEELEAKEHGRRDLAQAEEELEEFVRQVAEAEGALQGVAGRARRVMGGYPEFRKMVAGAIEVSEPKDGSPEELLGHIQSEVDLAGSALEEFGQAGVAKFFVVLSPVVLIVLAILGGAVGALPVLLPGFSAGMPSSLQVGYGMAGVAGLLLVINKFAGRVARPAAEKVACHLAQGRGLAAAAREGKRQEIKARSSEVNSEYERANRPVEERWKVATEFANQFRREEEAGHVERVQRVRARYVRWKQHAFRVVDPLGETSLAALRSESAGRIESAREECDDRLAQAEAVLRDGEATLAAEWKATLEQFDRDTAEMEEVIAPLSPSWDADYLARWEPEKEFAHVVRFGALEVDMDAMVGECGFAQVGARKVDVPLALQFPHEGSVIFETESEGRSEAVGALNNIILRLLTTTPPGKLDFTIIDPVGLGENFAGLMHLADYEDSLINGRIWTQRGQIEEKLAQLNEHAEKVIQMYLRNEYETITEYNLQAGNIAEKYHFVVVADFPSNFSETAAKRLLSIALTGARCGIYMLIHWDRRHTMPQEITAESLWEQSARLRWNGSAFEFGEDLGGGVRLALDAGPCGEVAIEFTQKVGQVSTDANRVEVPFAQIAPSEAERWSCETAKELRVPIGRTGATKLQYLAIGKGTRQHALFAGKTGSGKSTLFHVIITNLALWCSPDEVEFYLVDFKKGVEFKCYGTKRLPHARVVAIESDREFGLSVLQRVDDELKRRGDLFRAMGVQDVAGYKKAGGAEPMPRTLLMIDEFQEIFVEDDRIAQNASVLLDRIVRQGRAFGVHVLLGSQTLGGAYTLARTTLGQMVIRVALQCNEADAYLIMDDSNPAPRLLTRPGEGIYNDGAGAVEANSPFQVVWLPDDERDAQLDVVRAMAEEKGFGERGPIVFEGNAPAEVRENAELCKVLRVPATEGVAVANVWLGAPNSIKGPTRAQFSRQSGSNLLVVGQREEAALAMVVLSLVSLSAQYPVGGVRFVLCDGTTPGSSECAFLQRVVEGLPHEVRVVKNHDLPVVMEELDAEMKRRGGDEEAAAEGGSIYVLVYGLSKFKKLKGEDDFDFSFDAEEKKVNPGAVFGELISEGPSLGLHVIVTVDTFNNVNRFIGRKGLSEFEMRVLFQMSANDSASLADTPDGSNLGLHRALFYNEHEGYLETFRPYALPDNAWVEEVEELLRRGAPSGS